MYMHIDLTLCILQKPRAATVDEFIARMAPLLDMERDAEVAQVHLAFRVCLATSQPPTLLPCTRGCDHAQGT